ncbi:MAG TPA: S41 family peptidase [Humisphaera sp.]|jgi:hypothetical protein|nr:S41 family peptidase [Humisphaera sp.]
MRKLLVLAIGLSLLTGIFIFDTIRIRAEVTAAIDTSPVTSLLTVAQQQADFDLMRAALEEAHGGIYRYSSKAQMDRGFAEQRAKLNRPMTKIEFRMLLSETVALLRCGHTSVDADEQFSKAIKAIPMFPLRVRAEDDRLVVLFNDTADDQTIRPGMAVLSINGHNVNDVLARIWPLESADGDIEVGKKMHIPGSFAMYYWALVEKTDTFVIRAKDQSGRIVTATLAGVSRDDWAKNHNPVNAALLANFAKYNWGEGNLALRFVDDPKIAEMRVRLFIGDDFPKWMADTFKTLRDKGTQSLIIDLRNNGGGEDAYGALLVSYLTDKPFRYFDHISMRTISPTFKEHIDWNPEADRILREGTTVDPAGGHLVTDGLHHQLAEQSPAAVPFLGPVFVLTDGGTFSTAADFCAIAHHLKRATFIGEETGGGYQGNNSGLEVSLKLPNSQFEVHLPMYEYWNAVSPDQFPRRGTIPDHRAEMKVADLLDGRDTGLELAERLARENAK